MFSIRVQSGKAYAAEQKIKEFEKLLFKSKHVHKATSNKHFDSRKLICSVNMLGCRKYEQHQITKIWLQT